MKSKFERMFALALVLCMGISMISFAQSSGDYDDWDEPDDPHQHEHESVMVGAAVPANIQTSNYLAADAFIKNTLRQLDVRKNKKEEVAEGEEAVTEAMGNWNTWIAPYYRHSHISGLGESGATSRNNGGGSAFGADFGFGDLIIGGSFDAGHSKSTYKNGDVTSHEDSDFTAISIYGDWANDVLRIYGGIGYSYDSRDMKVKSAAFSKSAHTGTRSFNSAVICEYTVYDKAVYVAPYAGVRHAFIDTAAYHFGGTRYHSDTLNVFRFPVGIKVGQDYNFSGFYIRPNVNLYVEPVVGDTETKTKVRTGGVSNVSKARMTDEFFWNASVGVTTGIYGISFTLSYDFQGSEHEKEHGLSLSYNWCF